MSSTRVLLGTTSPPAAPVHPANGQAESGDRVADGEKQIFVATQRQLIWWRFRKHKLAMAGLIVVALFYLVALCADFLAYSDPQDTNARRASIPPQAISVLDGAGISPFTPPPTSQRDPVTLEQEYVADESTKIPIRLFVHGYD